MRRIHSMLAIGTLLASGLIGPASAHDDEHSIADPYLRGARWMFSQLNAGKLLCNRWPGAESKTIDFIAFWAFSPDLKPIADDDMNKLSSYQMVGHPDLNKASILYTFNDNLPKSSCEKINHTWVGAEVTRGPLPTVPGSEVVGTIRTQCSTDDKLVSLGISKLLDADTGNWIYSARFKSAGGGCYESTLVAETGEVSCNILPTPCNPRLKPPKEGYSWPPTSPQN